MTNSTAVEGILDRLGIAYKTEASGSWSDRHGPSCSVYFYTEHGTIRISDHRGSGGDLDLYCNQGETEVELEIRRLARMEISDEFAAKAEQEIAERLKRERVAWLQTPNGHAFSKELARKENREHRIIEDIKTLGLEGLAGRTRRQLIATLHSKSGRKALFTAHAEGRLSEVYPFS